MINLDEKFAVIISNFNELKNAGITLDEYGFKAHDYNCIKYFSNNNYIDSVLMKNSSVVILCNCGQKRNVAWAELRDVKNFGDCIVINDETYIVTHDEQYFIISLSALMRKKKLKNILELK